MIILITGITSGFGRAMAERLHADGHTVYGTHRNATEFIPGVRYIKADAQNEQDCEAAVKQVLDAEGRIDVFINNAGMGIGGPLEFTSLEDAQRQMDVNWMGMVRFLHWVVPAMRGQGGGKIICFSSIGGLMGLPFQGLYSASKFAIEGYCEALRLETKAFGIKVVVIEPGDFATNFTAKRKSVSDPRAYEVYKTYADAGTYNVYDFNSAPIWFAYDDGGKQLITSRYDILDADNYLDFANIDLDRLVESYQELSEYKHIFGCANQTVLKLLSAYDKSNDARADLLQCAYSLASWLVELDIPEEDLSITVRKINLWQTLKRMGKLTEEDQIEIFQFADDTFQEEVVRVGAYMILDNMIAAKAHFSKIPEEQKSLLRDYPIFRYWKT